MNDALQWNETSLYSGPQASPGFMMWSNFMQWQRELNTLLKPLGLTQPQFAILATCGWLTRDQNKITQQNLVNFLKMDRMHISQISARLEQNGLIERTASRSDQRSKTLKLTQAGIDCLSKAIPIVEAFDQHFFNAAQLGS